MLKLILVISTIIITNCNVALSDSLFKQSDLPLYSSLRSNRVGDIVTIYISESTSAIQEAGTKTSKQSSIGADYSDIWNQLAQNTASTEQLRKDQSYNIKGEDAYTGVGQTSRKSNVKTIVTAVVTEILENNNLFLVGEHKIKVNDETETIRISGVVRPEDLSPDNTVFSYQMAQVELSVKGLGVVGSKQTPGILTKLFGWLF